MKPILLSEASYCITEGRSNKEWNNKVGPPSLILRQSKLFWHSCDQTKFLLFFNRSNEQAAYTKELGIDFLKKDAMPKNEFTSEAHESVKKLTT